MPAPASETTLEAAALDKLRALENDGAPDLLARIISTYVDSSTELARAIRDAVAAGDPQAMAKAAHTLKSSSAQVGAERLSVLCKGVEALGRSGSLEGAAARVAELSAELECVHEALAAERFGAGNG